ncbi:MAG: 2OG-Fe(II) oxygenase [Deltaproteobacteria bacterium]|nr:2OG-Fe(II) oxygenase [Deltaproteobacteria bacterium]
MASETSPPGPNDRLKTPSANPKNRLLKILGALEAALAPTQSNDLGQPKVELSEWRQDEVSLAFHLQLCTLLRRGPLSADRQRPATSATEAPARLLTLAQQAATAGSLDLASLIALRRLPGELADKLVATEAWAKGTPLWWSPFPTPNLLEQLWQEISGAGETTPLPTRERLRSAFSATSRRRWLALPGLLSPAVADRLHGELEDAFQQGSLDLAAAGVGAKGEISSRRTDWVRYLKGTEAEVLAATPRLAALAQWGLATLGDSLGAALPNRPPSSPQSIMLARYPAPSAGFHPHLDNPGGPANSETADNGRSLTLVLYLNGPGQECQGGELALWPAGDTKGSDGGEVFPARSGLGVLFDSRTIPHQVRPVRPGPARWALTFWFNDALDPMPFAPAPRRPTVTELLLPLPSPPLPPEKVLLHLLEDSQLGSGSPGGSFVTKTTGREQQRIGIVCTIYRGGAALDSWCEYHFSLGFAHLLLVFDHLSETTEKADAERLRKRYPAGRLTLWSGEELQDSGWPTVKEGIEKDTLLATSRGGGSSYAVASRQALNASSALQIAQSDELGGGPLTWLLHLDSDEYFHLEGTGRGGSDLQQHFATASAAGWGQVRYVNHELLPNQERLSQPAPSGPRFKLHPRLAAARLGPSGWEQLVRHLKMAQDDPRPYFTGYHNGKSAVNVQAGEGAAGVHGWALRPGSSFESVWVAGPSILHHQVPSYDSFAAKYLSKAASPAPPHHRPFPPSPLEQAALAEIHRLQEEGAGEQHLQRALREIYLSRTTFTPAEVDLLEEAGLLFEATLNP